MKISVLDLIFPKRCVGCESLGSYICNRCKKTIIERIDLCPGCDRQAIDGKTHIYCQKKWGIDGLNSIFRNSGVIKKTIKILKYRFVTDVAQTLINFIPENYFPKILINNPDSYIYPIPLHKDRLRWRGFNQAEKLAVLFALKLNLPVVHGLLTRQVKRMPQADILTREQRILNAKGLFKLNSKKMPDNIILFDDVWTTGATMKEAAKVLKRGGVKKIWAFTMAR